MLIPLFAIRSVWVVILILLVVIVLAWFVIRVIGDAIVWFKEEILEDILERRRKSRERKDAKKQEKSREDS